MKLDLLAFAAHPDDVEMNSAGTLIRLVKAGKKVGIVDLTRGELGTRGTPEIRLQEAALSAEIMGIHARENLGFRDGFFVNDEIHQMEIIRMIRRYRPEIVLANAPRDRHPDHGKGADLVRTSFFLSGLRRISTVDKGVAQEAWRPKRLFYYIQDQDLEPDFVIDITEVIDQRIEAVKAFKSQFYDPESKEPVSYISTQEFWEFLKARWRNTGHKAGVAFGEGYISDNPLLVKSPFDLL